MDFLFEWVSFTQFGVVKYKQSQTSDDVIQTLSDTF